MKDILIAYSLKKVSIMTEYINDYNAIIAL